MGKVVEFPRKSSLEQDASSAEHLSEGDLLVRAKEVALVYLRRAGDIVDECDPLERYISMKRICDPEATWLRVERRLEQPNLNDRMLPITNGIIRRFIEPYGTCDSQDLGTFILGYCDITRDRYATLTFVPRQFPSFLDPQDADLPALVPAILSDARTWGTFKNYLAQEKVYDGMTPVLRRLNDAQVRDELALHLEVELIQTYQKRYLNLLRSIASPVLRMR